MLAGDNSILQKATDVRKKTDLSQLEEKIKLAVQSAIVDGLGDITYDNLKMELDSYFDNESYTITPEEDSTQWTIVVEEEMQYSITKNGQVQQLSYGLELTNENAYMIGYKKGITSELNIPGNFEYDNKKYTIVSLGKNLFSNDNTLKKIIIPDTVEIIKDGFVVKASSLEEVSIGKSVTEIGDSCFAYTSSLKRIDISEDNEKFKSVDGVVFSKSEKTLIIYPTAKSGNSYVVPDGVKTIGKNAFSAAQLSKITLSNSVRRIEDYAFQFSKIKDVEFTNSVREIGQGAFSNCEKLENIILPKYVTEIPRMCFFNCENLSNFTISSSISKIGEFALEDSKANITFEDYTSIDEIGDDSLRSCIIEENLAKKYLLSLNSYALGGKYDAGTVSFSQKYIFSEQKIEVEGLFNSSTNELIESWDSLINNKIIKIDGSGKLLDSSASKDSLNGKLIISTDITSIDRNAFSGCNGLTEIVIPESVISLGDGFATNTSITNLIIPNSVTNMGQIGYGLTKCKYIKIGNGVTTLPDRLFNQIHYMEKVKLGSGITVIPSINFAGSELKTIIFGKNIKTIQNEAFAACTKLNNIVLTGKIEYIGIAAFCGCTSLTNITIGKNVNTIEERVFINSNNIQTVYYEGTSQEFDRITTNNWDNRTSPIVRAQKIYNYTI